MTRLVRIATAAALLLVFAGTSRAQGLSMRVLRFDGRTGYVQLPNGIVDTLSQATVEAWVKWDRLRKWSRVFDFGRRDNSAAVRIEDTSSNLTFALFDRGGKEHRIREKDAIVPGVWYHVAASCGPGGMRLYLNGALVGTDGYRGGLDQVAGGRLFFGRSNWPDDELFEGEMAELRVWDRALSRDEIALSKDRLLTGLENGLVGYWPARGAGSGALADPRPGRLPATLTGGVTAVSVPAIARFLVPGELEKAAEDAYRSGLRAMQEAPAASDRSGYIEAYRHFQTARDLLPDYRDTDQRLAEAARKARFEVGLFLFATGRRAPALGVDDDVDEDAWRHWKTRRREVTEDLTASDTALRRLQSVLSDYVYRAVDAGKPAYVRLLGRTSIDPATEGGGGRPEAPGSADVLNAARQAGIDVVVTGEFSRADLVRRHASDAQRAYTLKKVVSEDAEGRKTSRQVEDQAYTYYVVDQEVRLAFDLFYEVLDVATGRALDRGRLSVEDRDGVQFVNWENLDQARADELYRRKKNGHERIPYSQRKLFGARRTLREKWPMVLDASEDLAADLSGRLLQTLATYSPPNPAR